MPRNMSFAMTTAQVKAKTKTVTRRYGWAFLKPGDILNAVEKAMGLQKGEKIKRLSQIRIISCRWQDLPIGSFSESGTNINTCIVKIFK